MARQAVTYGFGRIAKSRPSPYSRAHRQNPAPASRGNEHAPGKVTRVVVAAVLVGALIGIAAYAASVFVRSNEPAATIARPAPAQPRLSDEADRLSRSAIAVGRYTPRRGS